MTLSFVLHFETRVKTTTKKLCFLCAGAFPVSLSDWKSENASERVQFCFDAWTVRTCFVLCTFVYFSNFSISYFVLVLFIFVLNLQSLNSFLSLPLLQMFPGLMMIGFDFSFILWSGFYILLYSQVLPINFLLTSGGYFCILSLFSLSWSHLCCILRMLPSGLILPSKLPSHPISFSRLTVRDLLCHSRHWDPVTVLYGKHGFYLHSAHYNTTDSWLYFEGVHFPFFSFFLSLCVFVSFSFCLWPASNYKARKKTFPGCIFFKVSNFGNCYPTRVIFFFFLTLVRSARVLKAARENPTVQWCAWPRPIHHLFHSALRFFELCNSFTSFQYKKELLCVFVKFFSCSQCLFESALK